MPAHKVIQLKNGKKIYLRSIRRGDLEEIWDIFENGLKEGLIFPKYIKTCTEFDKINWYHNLKLYNNLSMIAEEIEDNKIFTCKKILGLVVIEKSQWDAASHVGRIYPLIRRDTRRMGLGAELLRFSIKEAKKRGKKKLIASINSENQNALKFFLKIGFNQIGHRENYFKINNKYSDEILMDIWI